MGTVGRQDRRLTPRWTHVARPQFAIGAFVALLAATPFIPRGDDDDSAIRPSGEREHAEPRRPRAAAPRAGVLTGAMRAEIDRVVAAGRALGRVCAGIHHAARERPRALCRVRRPAVLPRTGWTEDTEAEVRARARGHGARVAAARVLPSQDRGPGPVRHPAPARPRSALPPGRRRTRGARRSSPLGGQGVAAPPRDPGRAAARRLQRGAPGARPVGPEQLDHGDPTRRRHTDTPRVGKDPQPWRRHGRADQTYWCGPSQCR